MRQPAVSLADMARLMAQGMTVRQAAAELRVHENTLYYAMAKFGLRWWPIGEAANGQRMRRIAERLAGQQAEGGRTA